MKTASNVDPNVEHLIREFAEQIMSLAEQRILGRLQGMMGTPTARVPNGRPIRTPYTRECPVPGCKNPPAPIFGMVCSEHKDLPKAEIKKYREARAAAKKAKGPEANGKPQTKPSKPKGRRPAVPIA